MIIFNIKKISRDKIQRQINSIKDLRLKKNITVKKTRTKSNIKTKFKGMKLKKTINLINNLRPNTLLLKE
jgi:hypothetical protein